MQVTKFFFTVHLFELLQTVTKKSDKDIIHVRKKSIIQKETITTKRRIQSDPRSPKGFHFQTSFPKTVITH